MLKHILGRINNYRLCNVVRAMTYMNIPQESIQDYRDAFFIKKFTMFQYVFV